MATFGPGAINRPKKGCCRSTTSPCSYLGLCVGGLEVLVLEALREFLAPWGGISDLHVVNDNVTVEEPVRKGCGCCGKIIFSSSAPPGVITSLPIFITVLAFLGCHHYITNEKETAFQNIQDVIRESPLWDACLRLWAESHDHLQPVTPSRCSRLADPVNPFTFSFRASGIREGEHNFTRMDFWPDMGTGVCARFGTDRATVNVKDYDIEVTALLVDTDLLVGLNLHPHRTFRHGLPRESPSPPIISRDTTSSLRPSAAYLLLRLARLKAGEVLCDFMAGAGTLPLLAASPITRLPACLCLGGDSDSQCIHASTQNLCALYNLVAETGRGRGADICRWDARRLPLRDGCVDVGVTDLPFGKRCNVRGGIANLYSSVFQDIARVIRLGGRLVVLVGSRKYIDSVLTTPPNNAYWKAVPPWGLETGVGCGEQEEAEEEEEEEADGGSNARGSEGAEGLCSVADMSNSAISEGAEGLEAALPAMPCLPANIGGLLTWVYCLERTQAAMK